MLKKRIKYEDYAGNPREEDFYFNLSKSELIQMELNTTGGLEKFLNKIIAEQDSQKLSKMFTEIILMSYGEKSADDKYFYKERDGHRLADDFKCTPAFDALYMELFGDTQAMTDFVNGIVPKIENKPNVIPAPHSEYHN